MAAYAVSPVGTGSLVRQNHLNLTLPPYGFDADR